MIGHCYIQGVEKYIKAIYVGVAGKAKAIYKRKYSFSVRTNSLGLNTVLSNKSRAFASGSTGKYVIAAGGMGNSTSTRYKDVDAFDSSFTKRSLDPLRIVTSSLEGASFNSSVLTAGGFSSNGYCGYVDVYNSTLTHNKSVSNLSVKRSMPCCGTNSKYAIVAGGQSGKNTKSAAVDAYNASLTRTSASNLSVARSSLASATIGDITIFAGGYTQSSPNYSNAVDAYDSSLSKLSISTLSNSRSSCAGVANTKYAMFAGGEFTSSGVTAIMEAYNSDLTRYSSADLIFGGVIPGLTKSSAFLSAENVKGYVLFVGGKQLSDYLSNVDIIDEDMVKLDPITMKNKHSYCGTGVIDKTLFVMGGNISSNAVTNAIDIICAE